VFTSSDLALSDRSRAMTVKDETVWGQKQGNWCLLEEGKK
jgi:hypothetical protein